MKIARILLIVVQRIQNKLFELYYKDNKACYYNFYKILYNYTPRIYVSL